MGFGTLLQFIQATGSLQESRRSWRILSFQRLARVLEKAMRFQKRVFRDICRVLLSMLTGILIRASRNNSPRTYARFEKLAFSFRGIPYMCQARPRAKHPKALNPASSHRNPSSPQASSGSIRASLCSMAPPSKTSVRRLTGRASPILKTAGLFKSSGFCNSDL